MAFGTLPQSPRDIRSSGPIAAGTQGIKLLERQASSSSWITWVQRSLFIVLLWPTYLVFGTGTLNISVPRLLMVGWILIYALRSLSKRGAWPTGIGDLAAGKMVVFVFVVWAAWRLLCDFAGDIPSSSLVATILEFVGINSIAVLPLFVGGRPEGRYAIAKALFQASLVFMGLAILEWAFGLNVGSFFGSFTSANADLAQAVVEENLRDDSVRVKSLFAHPIILALNTGALTPLLLVMATSGRSTLMRTVAWGCVFLAPIVIHATQARSGYIVLGAAVASYFMLLEASKSRQSPAKILVMIGALIVGASVLLSSSDALLELVKGRTNAEVQSGLARTEMIDRGLQASADSPIFGYGHGQSANYAGLIGRNGFVTIDNYYLSTLLDFGVVGTALLLGFYLTVVIAGLAAAQHATDTFDRKFIVAMISAVIGLLPGLYIISSWDSTIIIYISAGVFASMRQRRKAVTSIP